MGALPEEGVLMTANFQFNPKWNLDRLQEQQPDRPTMVMEFWSGWFDHWFEPHNEIAPEGKFTLTECILVTFRN